jgi:hypothetical protein
MPPGRDVPALAGGCVTVTAAATASGPAVLLGRPGGAPPPRGRAVASPLPPRIGATLPSILHGVVASTPAAARARCASTVIGSAGDPSAAPLRICRRAAVAHPPGRCRPPPSPRRVCVWGGGYPPHRHHTIQVPTDPQHVCGFPQSENEARDTAGLEATVDSGHSESPQVCWSGL